MVWAGDGLGMGLEMDIPQHRRDWGRQPWAGLQRGAGAVRALGCLGTPIGVTLTCVGQDVRLGLPGRAHPQQEGRPVLYVGFIVNLCVNRWMGFINRPGSVSSLLCRAGGAGSRTSTSGTAGACGWRGLYFCPSPSAHFIQTHSVSRAFTFLFVIRTNKLHCPTKSLLILSKCKTEVCLGFFRRQRPLNKDVTSHAWSLFYTEPGGTEIQSKKMKTVLNFFANNSLYDTVQRRKVVEAHGR